MEDIPFKLTSFEDETLVDNIEVINDSLKKLTSNVSMAIHLLKNGIEKGALSKKDLFITTATIERETIAFLDKAGYKGLLKKSEDERLENIRAVQQQNRQLRKQLGEGVTTESIKAKLDNIDGLFRHWWNHLGIGHTSEDIEFNRYGANIKLSGSITKAFYNREAFPLCLDDEKSKKVYLEWLGFDFEPENDYLLMNQNNIDLLHLYLKTMFPSCLIEMLENRAFHGTQMTICSISIRIRNYADFNVLNGIDVPFY